MEIAPSRIARIAVRAAAVSIAGLSVVACSGNDAPAADSTRAIMSDVVEALRVALPPSFSSQAFADPANRDEIELALQSLAASAGRLERHGEGRGASFAFLSQSLARDVRDVERRYAAGRTDESRFLLHHATELCVACHARLPARAPHALGRQLMAAEALAALPPQDRAQFEMATRQFEPAAADFEAALADPAIAPADLDLEGLIDTWVELCLRVLQDPARARRGLLALAEREDVPQHLRTSLTVWIEDLESPPAARPDEPAVAAARRLIATARDRTRYRDDRQALIPLVTASGILYRYLDARTERTPEVGEAYYLLGVIEASVGRSFWASQTEHLLETSIRVAPAAPYAEDALGLLEELVIAGYTGSAGTHVPPDERERIDRLRALIADASEI